MVVARAQNGWPALQPTSKLLHTWVIPTKQGPVRVRLRGGSAGFLLCHVALYVADEIEPMKGRQADDWGHAYRAVRGSVATLSNHAAGCALDFNATQHPLGKAGTWSASEKRRINAFINHPRYKGTIRWGENYRNRVDPMHFEVVKPLPEAEAVARKLLDTYRGKRLQEANPGQRAVILR